MPIPPFQREVRGITSIEEFHIKVKPKDFSIVIPEPSYHLRWLDTVIDDTNRSNL